MRLKVCYDIFFIFSSGLIKFFFNGKSKKILYHSLFQDRATMEIVQLRIQIARLQIQP